MHAVPLLAQNPGYANGRDHHLTGLKDLKSAISEPLRYQCPATLFLTSNFTAVQTGLVRARPSNETAWVSEHSDLWSFRRNISETVEDMTQHTIITHRKSYMAVDWYQLQ